MIPVTLVLARHGGQHNSQCTVKTVDESVFLRTIRGSIDLPRIE